MKKITTKIDVNNLFDQINRLCSIPFSKLEPLSLNLESSNKEKQHDFDLLRSLRNTNKSKATSSGINEIKLPKTHSEVEDLFSEIGDFCRINLPFKLNDLDEDDRIDKSPAQETTQRVQLSQSRNKRIPLKSQEQNKNGSNHSFAKLMFNFGLNCTNNSNLKCDKKLERSTRVTRSRATQNINCKAREIKLTNSKQISPLCLSSSIDLKSSLKSCRSYISLMKTNENKEDAECAIKKRKTSKRKSIALLSKDDSLESGYSSSQSSVHSPAASLLSTDLEELNKSSLSSNCSTSTNSSLTHNINPNGEIIYLRSQVDFYLDKTSKRKRKAISCDKQTLSYQVPSSVDHHQKVIEWQCKTLLNNSCPTPQHDHFEDTPPHSPMHTGPPYDVNNDENNNNYYDDQLDLDCLQDLCGTADDNQPFQDDMDLDLMLQAYQECGTNLDYAYPLDIDSILS